MIFKMFRGFLGKGLTDFALETIDRHEARINDKMASAMDGLIESIGLYHEISKASPGLPSTACILLHISAYTEYVYQNKPEKYKDWNKRTERVAKKFKDFTVQDYNDHMKQIGMQ